MPEYPEYTDPDTLFLPRVLPGQRHDTAPPSAPPPYGTGWSFDDDLAHLLDESRRRAESEARPSPGPGAARRAHHRRGGGPPRQLALPASSFVITVLLVATFAGVSTVGGVVTYGFARTSAATVVDGLASWWPVLLHGPWVAASLFMLRSPAVRGRRARAGWTVLFAFSAVTAALCLTQTRKDFIGIAVAVLPPVAALACLRLLVLHITPLHPRHALPHRRHPHSHRAH